jgi:hypothetical protein
MLRSQRIWVFVRVAASVAAMQLVLAVPAIGVEETAPGASPKGTSSRQVAGAAVQAGGSEQTYRVLWVPGANIVVDGRPDEPVWSNAVVEQGFVFPWKQAQAPATEFRAVCDEANFYFTFRVRDDDVVALERLRDEQEAVFEDRVEMYFGLDEQMKDYFCLEVDTKGRAFDYRGSYYRQLEPNWKCEGLETKATALPHGYEVEGRIPVETFVALGFPALRPGAKIRCGLYRAEFSHDRSGRAVERPASIHNMGLRVEGPPPIEEWLSWVDPKTKDPDFHVPSSMGWMEIVKKPDYSGTYVLDMQRTKLQINRKVLSGEIILEHREPSFKFRRAFRIEGRETLETSEYEITTDGREVVKKDGDVTSRQSMTWDGDSLVFAENLSSPRWADATNTVRYRLEDGGKTLVAEERFRGPWNYDNLWVAVRK